MMRQPLVFVANIDFEVIGVNWRSEVNMTIACGWAPYYY